MKWKEFVEKVDNELNKIRRDKIDSGEIDGLGGHILNPELAYIDISFDSPTVHIRFRTGRLTITD